jgi:hypothetical protein
LKPTMRSSSQKLYTKKASHCLAASCNGSGRADPGGGAKAQPKRLKFGHELIGWMVLAWTRVGFAKAMGRGLCRNLRLVDGAKDAARAIGLDGRQRRLDVAHPLVAAV